MLSTHARRALGAAFAVAAVAATATSAQAATITVNSSADKGSGTLRDAINAANGTPAVADTIKFKIPGSGVRTISLASPLPSITSQLTINGYTQNGAAAATDSAAAQLK